MKNESIFLHALPRTSSTYVFEKLRRPAYDTYCYNEPHHEIHATLTREQAKKGSSATWPAGHHPPDFAPYYFEYLPLLQESGGTLAYKREYGVANFFPSGPLSEGEIAYLRLLEENARKRNLRPVYGFCHSFGRVGHIRKAFTGVHVVQYRNPHQVLASLMKLCGEGFFCSAVKEAKPGSLLDRIGFAGPDILHAELDPVPESLALVTSPALYALFFEFYVIGVIAGAFYADLLLSVDLLAHDTDYRAAFTRDFEKLTGIAVNFADAKLPDKHEGAIYNPTFFEDAIEKYAGSEERLKVFKNALEAVSGTPVCKSIQDIQEMIEIWKTIFPSSKCADDLILCIIIFKFSFGEIGVHLP
ncbi:MAG: hypothetical protein LBL72_10410 [Candidatus Accumulibacter sp.]|jgi:hypothetical protein|nr:hypothetical protein [Accumulibacter sp.]